MTTLKTKKFDIYYAKEDIENVTIFECQKLGLLADDSKRAREMFFRAYPGYRIVRMCEMEVELGKKEAEDNNQ